MRKAQPVEMKKEEVLALKMKKRKPNLWEDEDKSWALEKRMKEAWPNNVKKSWWPRKSNRERKSKDHEGAEKE